MRWSDPLTFCVGQADAIRRIATSWSALITGALLVVTAGIARNYDHHLFFQEPLWIVGPFGVSIVSSLIVYGFTIGFLKVRKASGWAGYLSFLSLFWMTAPIAWLYAVPVERWLEPLPAAKVNAMFLGVVALWRVLLMGRSVSVICGISFLRGTAIILLPASLEMAIGTFLYGFEYAILAGMGGITLPEDQQWMMDLNQATFSVSAVLFLLLLVTFAVLAFRALPHASPFGRMTGRTFHPLQMVLLPMIACLLLATQPVQADLRRSQRVAELMVAHDWETLRQVVRDKSREDFSPIIHPFQTLEWLWNNRLGELLVLVDETDPDWMVDGLFAHADRQLQAPYASHYELCLSLLATDRGQEIAERHRDKVLQNLEAAELRTKLTTEQKALLEAFRDQP